MNAVDTNVLVRLITRDDARQTRAAEEFVDRGAWVSHLVLAETTWVLAAVYDLEPPLITRAVEMLLDHERITVQDRNTVLSALDQFKNRPTLGFTDALVLEVARKAGHLPLGTFDRKLGNLQGAQRL